MNLMIDWDGTYTTDYDLWTKVVVLFRLKGWRVYIVTSRGPDTPIEKEPPVDKVVYCDYKAKKEVCDELGIDIDIWIDNDPKYILESFLVPYKANNEKEY